MKINLSLREFKSNHSKKKHQILTNLEFRSMPLNIITKLKTKIFSTLIPEKALSVLWITQSLSQDKNKFRN